MNKENEGVFAILRYDGYLGPDASVETTVTVKEVVRSQAIAEAEVARLNVLNADKKAQYWWQYTRLYPSGKSASSCSVAVHGPREAKE
jgi:hypothetical protein